MAEPRKLTLHLDGLREEEGYVQAQDFLEFLQHALGVFRRLEREQTGASATTKTHTTFRIVDLEIGSATVVLEPSAPTGINVNLMFSQFAEGIAVYRDRTAKHSRLDRGVLEEIEKMLAPVARGRVRRAVIEVDTVKLQVDATGSGSPFEIAPPPETNVLGSVSGFVDVINVHKEPVFYLYPSEGPRIACRFDRTYLDDAKLALKKFCRVHGLLTFTESSPHPLRLDVDRIELAPARTEVRSLRSFVGAVPDLTGGVEAVEYLRRLRDAES